MKSKKKTKKTRSSNYEPKLKIDGTFDDVIGVSVRQDDKSKALKKKEKK
jgi:hypothetical protein